LLGYFFVVIPKRAQRVELAEFFFVLFFAVIPTERAVCASRGISLRFLICADFAFVLCYRAADVGSFLIFAFLVVLSLPFGFLGFWFFAFWLFRGSELQLRHFLPHQRGL